MLLTTIFLAALGAQATPAGAECRIVTTKLPDGQQAKTRYCKDRSGRWQPAPAAPAPETPTPRPVAPVAGGASNGNEPECRVSSYTTQDGRRGTMRYCKDSTGAWRRVGGVELPQAPLPSKAQIRFRGTYQVTVTQPGRQSRQLNLGALLGSDGSSQQLEGAITFAASFDGAAVTATVSGTGGMSTIRVSGLVRNGACRLVDDRQTIVYEGRCDRNGFKGTIKSQQASRNRVSGTFETQVDEVN